MRLLETLHRKRPLEVYVLAAILFVLLFLNPAGLFYPTLILHELGGFERGYLFHAKSSIIRGLIHGLGDDHLGDPQGALLHGIAATVYVAVVFLKGPQISNWLWSDKSLKPRSLSD